MPPSNRHRGAGGTIQILEQLLEDAELLRIKVEEFDVTGFQALRHVFSDKGMRLLIVPDDDDILEIVNNVLKKFITSVSQSNFEERTETIIQLSEALDDGTIVVRVDERVKSTKWRAYDDANIYIADATGCIVGAPDLISTRLNTPSDGLLVLRELDEVTQFVAHFDKHFRLCYNLNKQLIERLQNAMKG